MDYLSKKRNAKKILIRADGNPDIGMGHIMRCLSIADSEKERGIDVSFILADNEVSDIVRARGYEGKVLDTRYDRMMEELDRLSAVISESRPDFLIIDSYFVYEEYLNVVWNTCKKVSCLLVYMDDVLSFPYPCDILINYNIFATLSDYSELYKGSGLSPEFLLGADYVPLRKEFRDLPHRIMRQDPKDILVSTGGADSEHMTLTLLDSIIDENKAGQTEDYVFHFVIGAMNKDRNVVRKKGEAISNVRFHENVTNMCALMLSCDAAISAAGSTLYELLATETPTVTYVLADNQIPGAESFASRGLMKNCGDVRVLGREELARRLIREAVKLIASSKE